MKETLKLAGGFIFSPLALASGERERESCIDTEEASAAQRKSSQVRSVCLSVPCVSFHPRPPPAAIIPEQEIEGEIGQLWREREGK